MKNYELTPSLPLPNFLDATRRMEVVCNEQPDHFYALFDELYGKLCWTGHVSFSSAGVTATFYVGFSDMEHVATVGWPRFLHFYHQHA